MSETKFTKGPWVFNPHDGSITDKTAASNCIAGVELEGWEKLGMGYANAHLIAAAPEMYAMLEESEILLRDGTEEHANQLADSILVLLAKARGEL